MGCDRCEVAQELYISFMYRWNNANITIVACSSHAREVMDALNKIQNESQNKLKGS